jgi:Zn-dependent protease with chaperone function
MNYARIAAVLTWVYAAGFGISVIPVAVYLLQRGRLPTFFGLFPMYGGPWSSRLGRGTFVVLMIAFLIVTVVAAWAAWLIWNGSKVGAIISLVLLPVEAVFWLGFALPFPVADRPRQGGPDCPRVEVSRLTAGSDRTPEVNK